MTRWSTAGTAADRRFLIWATRELPSLARLFRVTPIGAFETSVAHVQLGTVLLQYASGTARRYDRSLAQLRADGIDLLGVCLLLTGTLEGATGTGEVRAGPGAILLIDLTQPFGHIMSAAESIQIGVPRALAEQHLGPVDALHGVVVDPGRAAMIVDHLASLRRSLPTMTVRQGPRHARVLLDLLAIALGRAEDGPPPPPLIGRAAAEAAIEARLGEQRFDAAVLCADLHISRATLFRLFKRDGGFQAFARGRRLDHVRSTLDDRHNKEPIAALALRWGFSDSPHLSRLFRARFGVTPSHYRASRAARGRHEV